MSIRETVLNLPKEEVQNFLKLHGVAYDSDSSDGGKSELDDEYYAHRLPPLSDYQLFTNSVNPNSINNNYRLQPKEKNVQCLPTNTNFPHSFEIQLMNNVGIPLRNTANIESPLLRPVFPSKPFVTLESHVKVNTTVPKSYSVVQKKGNSSSCVVKEMVGPAVVGTSGHLRPTFINRPIVKVPHNEQLTKDNLTDTKYLNESHKIETARKLAKRKTKENKSNVQIENLVVDTIFEKPMTYTRQSKKDKKERKNETKIKQNKSNCSVEKRNEGAVRNKKDCVRRRNPNFISADLITMFCSQLSFFLVSPGRKQVLQRFSIFSKFVFINVSLTIIKLLYQEF